MKRRKKDEQLKELTPPLWLQSQELILTLKKFMATK